jgi:hypothetical protein
VSLNGGSHARRERWQELCEQAANEQDSRKLAVLIEEINRLLHEKDSRLKAEATERVKSKSA